MRIFTTSASDATNLYLEVERANTPPDWALVIEWSGPNGEWVRNRVKCSAEEVADFARQVLIEIGDAFSGNDEEARMVRAKVVSALPNRECECGRLADEVTPGGYGVCGGCAADVLWDSYKDAEGSE